LKYKVTWGGGPRGVIASVGEKASKEQKHFHKETKEGKKEEKVSNRTDKTGGDHKKRGINKNGGREAPGDKKGNPQVNIKKRTGAEKKRGARILGMSAIYGKKKKRRDTPQPPALRRRGG